MPALGMGRAYMGRFVGNSPVRRGEGGGAAQGGPLWSPAVPFHFPCNLKNLPVKALVGTLSGGQVTRRALLYRINTFNHPPRAATRAPTPHPLYPRPYAILERTWRLTGRVEVQNNILNIRVLGSSRSSIRVLLIRPANEFGCTVLIPVWVVRQWNAR